MAYTGFVGSIGEFDSTAENITAYLERLEMYIVENVIAEGKKVSVLLTVIGVKNYHLLRNLPAPNLPQEKSYGDLVGKLKSLFSPKPLVISERFNFYSHKQDAK